MGAKPLILGHRGASDVAPENTLAAFQAGLDVGVDGFELDVQLSSDGELVVIHDERADRTTSGKGWVKDMTLAELKKLDAGSWFNPKFAGERIPTLGEVLELVADRCALINVEIKSGVVLYPGIEAKIISLLKKFHAIDKTVLSSFNHFSLRTAKVIDPAVKTGVLYMEGLVDPWVYAKQVPADALHPAFYAVVPEIVKGAHAGGLTVNTWTVDKPDDMRRMIACGVDAVITNCPKVMLDIVKEE
ncbi:MAG: glycerophosphodiester phosphodiesterase [Bacillota bacterium]